MGLEPTTFWMPFKRSPNWATSPYIWCLGWDLNPQNAGFESATYANSVTKAYLKDERVSTALITDSSRPYILHSAYKKGKFLLYLLPKLVPSFLYAMTLSASTLPCGRYWWTWRGSNTRPPACKASALPNWSTGPYRVATYLCTDGVANHPLFKKISLTTSIGELTGRRVIYSDRISQIYAPVLTCVISLYKRREHPAGPEGETWTHTSLDTSF